MTESTFRLSVFVLACKKSGYFICSVLRNRQFYSSKTRLATPIFGHPQSASTLKEISLFYLFILQIESILESHHMTGHIDFLATPSAKISNVCYNQLKSVNSWDTVNFRVKDQNCSICYGEIVHLEVMQFGWLRVFWPTSQEWDFSQT